MAIQLHTAHAVHVAGLLSAAAAEERAGQARRRLERGRLWTAICWLIGHRQQFEETLRGRTWCPRCWQIVAAP